MAKAAKRRTKARQIRLPFWAKLTISVLALIGLGLIIFLIFKPKATPKYTGPIDHITTGYIGEYASLILIAQDQGYFKDYGLDVTTKAYASGPAALTDLLAGKLDIALASDFAGVRNSFAGQDLKIFADVSKSEAFFIDVRTDHGIAKTADLKGKKIGLTRKTVGEFYLGQYLTYNNLTVNDVTLVDEPQANLVADLAAGKLDAAVLFEPNAYNAQARLGTKIAAHWSIQNGESINSMLFTTSRLITSYPEALKRYLQALVEAQAFIKNHDPQARTIIAKRLNYTSAYINYVWPRFQFNLSLDQELLLNMDDEARWTIENHLTPATQVPNYLHFLDQDPLKSVSPESITIIQ